MNSEDPQHESAQGSMQGHAEIWCSVRPDLPAAAFCMACKRRYSGRFLSVLPDGRAACFRCVRDLKLGTIQRFDESKDPVFQRGLFPGILAILYGSPHQLLPRYKGPITQALLLGIAATMIGLWASTTWFLNSEAADTELLRVVERIQAQGQTMSVEELRRAIPWFVPIVAVLRMVMGVAIVHLMIRLVAPKPTLPLRAHARLYALSCVSMLLLLIPGFWGATAANMTWALVTFSWLRAAYPQMNAWRVMLIVFPHIFILGMG